MHSSSSHRFKFGEKPVVQQLDSSQLPIQNAEDTKPDIDIEELTTLRRRQIELRLMDTSGNLYDPSTKRWVCAGMILQGEPSIFDNMNYFETHPEMLAGLPEDAPPPSFSLENTSRQPRKPWRWGEGMEPSAETLQKYAAMPPQQKGIRFLPLEKGEIEGVEGNTDGIEGTRSSHPI